MIHCSMEYKQSNKLVHKDICPPGCSDIDCKEWREDMHKALDELLDKGRAQGFLVIKQEGFDMNSGITLKDLATLAGLKAKLDIAVEQRLSQIDRNYLNQKEATRLVNFQADSYAGIDSIIKTFSFIQVTEPAEYDSKVHYFENAMQKEATQKSSKFTSFLDRAKELLCLGK